MVGGLQRHVLKVVVGFIFVFRQVSKGNIKSGNSKNDNNYSSSNNDYSFKASMKNGSCYL